jgi:hypothetical protein
VPRLKGSRRLLSLPPALDPLRPSFGPERHAHRLAAVSDEQAIRELFREAVFGFIFHDIEREIWLAQKTEHDKLHGIYPGPHPGAGNVLAALGLLAYTEFLGSFITGNRNGMQENFKAFLSRMPPCYSAFDAHLGRDPQLKGVYHTFRNGMAHEYAVKRDCDVVMLRGRETCGIGQENGRYYFVVEHYFDDFRVATNSIYQDLLRKPVLPS